MKKCGLSRVVVGCFALLSVGTLFADSYHWTRVDAGTYYWTNALNWAEGVVPPSDSSADIMISNSLASVTTAYTLYVSGDQQINGIKFLKNGSANSKATLRAEDEAGQLSLGAGGLALDSYSETALPYSQDKSMPSPSWYVPLHLTDS